MKTRQQHIDGLFEKIKKDNISAELCGEIKSDIQEAVRYQKTANLAENILSTSTKAEASGYTLLMWASYGHHLEIVQELLKNKVDVDLQDKKGRTALFVALLGGEKDKYAPTVDALLKAGAHPNTPSHDGTQPFHWAIMNRDIETLNKFVAESKAISTGKTKENETSLMFAVKKDSLDLTQRVIELIPKDKLESELQEKNASGKTVFDLANEPSIIALLLSHVTNIPNPAGLLQRLRRCDQTDSGVVTALKILFNKAPSPELQPQDKRDAYKLYKEKSSQLAKLYDEEIIERLGHIDEFQLSPDLLNIVVQYDAPAERYSPRMFYNSNSERSSDVSGIEEAIEDFRNRRRSPVLKN